MSFSNPFFIISLVVLLSVIVIGTIVMLILRKKKVSEKARSLTSITIVFAALLLCGLLVYTITMNMMYDLLAQKRYTEFPFDSPDKAKQLVIKEYSSSKETGFDIYYQDEKIGEVSTLHYLPFGENEYQVDWQGEDVIITYTYENNEDNYTCKSCRVSLKNASVSESSVVEKNLAKLKEESAAGEKQQ